MVNVIILFVIESYFDKAALIIFSLFVIVFGAKVALPKEAHRERTVRFSAWIMYLVFTLGIGGPNIWSYVTELLKKNVPILSGINIPVADYNLVLTVMILTFLAHIATLYFYRNTGALSLKGRDDAHLTKSDYRSQRALLIENIQSNMLSLDNQLRWQSGFFVELKAEIDSINHSRPRRRVVNLVEALREDKSSNIFLVLGVPGSGKSVSLRKCCQELLLQSKNGAPIPLYIDLKGWVSNHKWSSNELPSSEEFSVFVKNAASESLGYWSKLFFEDNFERLVNSGQIFFIFDSFDEIPGLLDSDENSYLLNQVSTTIIGYLKTYPNSRGILASRNYRRPRLGQESHATLEIRPFTGEQIIKALRLTIGEEYAKELLQAVFVDRPELAPIAQNPFSLGLLAEFWRTERRAPDNQLELYQSHIQMCIKNSREMSEEYGISKEDLMSFMSRVSWLMFESASDGLEISVEQLKNIALDVNVDNALNILQRTRLMRFGEDKKRVSFVHRRFNEFFLVSAWLSGSRKPPHEAIPTDTRYRDSLVLFAEVTDDRNAEHLAEYCWAEIKALASVDPADKEYGNLFARGVHSMRFLAEAFRARKQAISTFRDELAEIVEQTLSSSDSILFRLYAAEAVGLINPSTTVNALMTALRANNLAIREVAFRSCRYLGNLPEKTRHDIFWYLRQRPIRTVLFPTQETKYILNTSDTLKSVKSSLLYFRIEQCLAILLFLGGLIYSYIEANNYYVSILALVFLISLLMNYGFEMHYELETTRKTQPSARSLKKAPFIFLPIEMICAWLGQGHSKYTSRNVQHFTKIETELWDTILHSIRIGTPIALILTPVFLLMGFYLNNPLGFDVFDISVSTKLLEFDLIKEELKQSYKFKNSTWVFVIASFLSLGPISYFTQMYSDFRFWIAITIRIILFHVMIAALLLGIYFILTLIWDRDVIIAITSYIIKYIFPLSLLLLLPLFVFLLTLYAFIHIAAARSDRRLLDRLGRGMSADRQQIANEFKKFKTETGRSLYLDHIERLSSTTENFELLRDIASNPWPDHIVPNIDDGLSSTRLAKLDARWLRLDL